MIIGRTEVVLDAAGGDIGGAARWHGELSSYLASTGDSVRVIGRGRRLTPRWLVEREHLARGADLVVAPNNACFALSGAARRVLPVNALHYLYPLEEYLLNGFTRRWRTQIPVVRRLVTRADLVVVPCSAMADRVVYHVPAVRDRVVVRPHPVTPAGPRQPADVPFVLVPVVPARYKNLFTQLRLLVEAADRLAHPAEIRVTAHRRDLPRDLAAHPRITTTGVVPYHELAAMWRSASSVFFPSVVESFGFALAEARAYGVPVIAPDTGQSREIAGRALRGYDPTNPSTIAAALLAADEPTTPDPVPFDRDSYFRWLLGPRPLPVGVGQHPEADVRRVPAHGAEVGPCHVTGT